MPHRKNFDSIIIHGCGLAGGERLTPPVFWGATAGRSFCFCFLLFISPVVLTMIFG